MMTRRDLTLTLGTALATGSYPLGALARARSVVRVPPDGSFAHFLNGVRSDALRQGLSPAILDSALALSAPNARVLQLDRRQPEFTMTWTEYKARVVSSQRQHDALQSYQENLPLLTKIWERYRVDPRAVIGIWGLESNFGSRIGTFNVVDALATLAFDGRRASFFRSELMASLQILDHGDVSPSGMIGSYAGAMGQPQFMPTSYLRYAVDYQGDGRRDIWTSREDVFASIANYLARCGWVAGEPWGQQVTLTRPVIPGDAGRLSVRSLAYWDKLGVRHGDGSRLSRLDAQGALLIPDGAAGDAFLVYTNFNVIRRYNPSDFYALAVGLIGNAAA